MKKEPEYEEIEDQGDWLLEFIMFIILAAFGIFVWTVFF